MNYRYRPKLFVREFFSLMEYCESDQFDQKFFALRHDEYTRHYKRLSVEEQGEIAELIVSARAIAKT